MESLTVHDLTAAYALDALDPDEAREYEEHLARCERCQRELASLGGAATALAYATETPAPPAALRNRILTTARAERENVVPLRPRWTTAAKAITAVAACLAIGFGIWAASLARSLESTRDARDQANRAVAVLSDPAAQRLPLKGASGSLVVGRSGDAALIVNELGTAPSGKTYEAWVIQDGMPRRAGTFEGGGDRSVVPLDRPVPKGASVAVTIEKDGGVDAPQGQAVLSTKPV
jgi:Anti-sigma-K factor rskA, C-terminal/Putative zinc-finger